MSITTDRNGNALEPGGLYAAFENYDEGSSNPGRLVGYVYWTGVELVHDDDGESFDGDVDYLVPQSGAPINEEMIDEDYLQRMDAIAEARAEYRATGGDL